MKFQENQEILRGETEQAGSHTLQEFTIYFEESLFVQA